MLGGSFWVSVIRNCLGASLMMSVFLLLDHPRFSIKKTVYASILFILLAGLSFSAWYLLDKDTYIRLSAMFSIPVCGAFCIYISRDTLYLSLYKITLGFYLLALTVFAGIDISRILFGGSMWMDIIIRFLITAGIIFFIISRIRKPFLEGIDYLKEEMDWFSAVTVVVSVLIAALVAFWPGPRVLSAIRIFRIILLFFLSGVIQYLIFQFYFHRGKERRYQVEKELLETNEQLIQRQLDLMRESKEELARIRHDAKHHCLLIEEYIRNGENEKLISYVKQYREDLESRELEKANIDMYCSETINNILSVYAKRAQEEHIEVNVHAKTAGSIAAKNIDLVAVIANIFENAIQGCCTSCAAEKKIQISVTQKRNKIVIQCKNTCSPNVKLKHGLPESDTGEKTGILSILKVVNFYNGEAQFSVEDGMFIARILLNIAKNTTPKKS